MAKYKAQEVKRRGYLNSQIDWRIQELLAL